MRQPRPRRAASLLHGPDHAAGLGCGGGIFLSGILFKGLFFACGTFAAFGSLLRSSLELDAELFFGCSCWLSSLSFPPSAGRSVLVEPEELLRETLSRTLADSAACSNAWTQSSCSRRDRFKMSSPIIFLIVSIERAYLASAAVTVISFAQWEHDNSLNSKNWQYAGSRLSMKNVLSGVSVSTSRYPRIWSRTSGGSHISSYAILW